MKIKLQEKTIKLFIELNDKEWKEFKTVRFGIYGDLIATSLKGVDKMELGNDDVFNLHYSYNEENFCQIKIFSDFSDKEYELTFVKEGGR